MLNNDVLQSIDERLDHQNQMLAEIAVNLARLLGVMEAASGIESRAIPTPEGLRVEVRPKPQKNPLLVVPR